MHEKFFVLDNFIERVKNVENAINCWGLSRPQSPGHGHSPDSTPFCYFMCLNQLWQWTEQLDNAGYLQKNIFHPCYLTYQSSENQLFCCYTIEHIISKGSPHDLSIIITIIIFG